MIVQIVLEIEDDQLKNVPDAPKKVADAIAARLKCGLLVVDPVQK